MISVRRRPGGLPSAPGGTGRLAIVRPGRPKGRTAVFGQDGGPYRVRYVGTGKEDGRQGTVGDGRDWLRTAGDCGGRPGTARVMFHDATMIISEVYDLNSG